MTREPVFDARTRCLAGNHVQNQETRAGFRGDFVPFSCCCLTHNEDREKGRMQEAKIEGAIMFARKRKEIDEGLRFPVSLQNSRGRRVLRQTGNTIRLHNKSRVMREGKRERESAASQPHISISCPID